MTMNVAEKEAQTATFNDCFSDSLFSLSSSTHFTDVVASDLSFSELGGSFSLLEDFESAAIACRLSLSLGLMRFVSDQSNALSGLMSVMIAEITVPEQQAPMFPAKLGYILPERIKDVSLMPHK